MGKLQGKVAVVTASTKGIGLASVKAMTDEGATVYMAVRNPELGETCAAEINAAGKGVAKVVYLDSLKFETYEPAVDQILAESGRIDIVVNNYGGTSPMKDFDIVNGNVEQFNKDMNGNLSSVYHLCNLVLKKAMVPQKSGSIINIASVAGVLNNTGQTAYGVAKSGVIHLSKSIAVQVGRYGIRCNTVSPGMTATAAVADNLPEAYQDMFYKGTPMIRMAAPEEIAAGVLYFACDESAFTTGQNLSIDGGYAVATPVYGDEVGAKALAKQKKA